MAARFLRSLLYTVLLTTAYESIAAADDSGSFVLEATGPQPYTAAYLGNGAISLVTTPLATDPARCFLAGVYDHTAGDVPRIASAPAWNEVDIYNGSHWLNAVSPLTALEQYHQTLDMFNGVLRTSYVWADGDKRIRIEAEEFVSRDRPQLAANRVTITPAFAGTVNIRFPLRNWPPPHRYALEKIQKLDREATINQWAIWYPGQLDITKADAEQSSRGALLSLSANIPGYESKFGEAVAIDWAAGAHVEVHRETKSADIELSLRVEPGQSYAFTKFASLITSATDPGTTAKQAALAARQQGWQAMRLASEAAWHTLWQSDLIIEGNPSLQRTIHSMLFYLLGSTRPGLDISIPPMGLSSAGYYGHIFWDADTYMFPPIVILHPELALPMVAFRSRTRDAALQNAKRNGYKGAMYPWEADSRGVECTPRFAFQNATSENHVNGDVALAAWQYWQATGDRNWLEKDAWPILRDTADFWASRVKYNAKHGRYEIGNVVAVKESDIGVSNDAYTNAVAKKNLEVAIDAAHQMKVEPHPEWREIAAKMYVPASDSPMLSYSLGLPSSLQQIRDALGAVLRHLDGGHTGAMMGTEFYPILAAQIGDRRLIGQLLEPLVGPYLRPPFQVLAETPESQNINFITGAGAFLQQFVFGYTGLRFGENGLESRFRPALPPGIQKLTLRNITIRGKRQTLVFNSGSR